MERREFLRGSVAFLISHFLTGCVQAPSPQEVIFESSPTPQLDDHLIETTLQEAKQKEVIFLKEPLIGYLIRFPWIDGSAIIATLDVPKNGEFDRAAIILSADCLYWRFRQGGNLGDSVGPGIWRPNQRIDGLEAVIAQPFSVTSPWPIIEAKSILSEGEKIDCGEEKAVDQLREIVERIKWEEIPEDIGEVLGTTIRGFIKGFEEGVVTSTPES